MNFEFSDDERMVQKAVRELLEKQFPLARVRGILESGGAYDREL